jgi:hypothetical protein
MGEFPVLTSAEKDLLRPELGRSFAELRDDSRELRREILWIGKSLVSGEESSTFTPIARSPSRRRSHASNSS